MISALAVFVVGYVAAAHAPIGGRYVWQWPTFDTTRHAMLTWSPLIVSAWLLAGVLIWSAMRRLPWRIDNLGAFIAVLGLAIILISQSWAFRSQTLGIAAVPISESTGNAQADALSLNYTTRYGDAHDRVLVVMAGGGAPITIPLDDIPRWNDATGDRMPVIKLHNHPKLASVIGYGTRIKAKAYLADGTLTETEDGTQTAEATGDGFRDIKSLPYPSDALLALEITTDLEDGSTQTTTAWLPFEPEGTDSLVPDRFFPVEGLGSVGLAFRPASKKLPFALAAKSPDDKEKWELLELSISDTDPQGRLLEPQIHLLSSAPNMSFLNNYQALDDKGRLQSYELNWLNQHQVEGHALLVITPGTSNPFILAGMITFVLGVFLDRLIDWLGSRPSKPKDASKPALNSQSPIPNAKP